MELITIREYENGGKIQQYQAVDTSAGDYPKVFACCDYFARQGATAIITPAFLVGTIGNPEYEEIYSSLKGSPYWGKCPDFCVNGIWYEHEGYNEAKDLSKPSKRADTFSKMLNRGLKQSDRIIIEDCGVGHSYAHRSIFRRIRFEGQNIREIYIRTQTGLELFYKKEAE
ncbi:MAG: hypothetical protein LBV74_00285, partial [Tannerella sp.]|jgi:hypothetical protein|nr:hypothetical protein [Tannerella sp.]